MNKDKADTQRLCQAPRVFVEGKERWSGVGIGPGRAVEEGRIVGMGLLSSLWPDHPTNHQATDYIQAVVEHMKVSLDHQRMTDDQITQELFEVLSHFDWVMIEKTGEYICFDSSERKAMYNALDRLPLDGEFEYIIGLLPAHFLHLMRERGFKTFNRMMTDNDRHLRTLEAYMKNTTIAHQWYRIAQTTHGIIRSFPLYHLPQQRRTAALDNLQQLRASAEACEQLKWGLLLTSHDSRVFEDCEICVNAGIVIPWGGEIDFIISLMTTAELMLARRSLVVWNSDQENECCASFSSFCQRLLSANVQCIATISGSSLARFKIRDTNISLIIDMQLQTRAQVESFGFKADVSNFSCGSSKNGQQGIDQASASIVLDMLGLNCDSVWC